VTVILAYAFFGLDALGQELEEPFGVSANAVPLDALVRNIEIAVLDALGDQDLPPPLLPQDFLLL
jgi:putative membrane protein